MKPRFITDPDEALRIVITEQAKTTMRLNIFRTTRVLKDIYSDLARISRATSLEYIDKMIAEMDMRVSAAELINTARGTLEYLGTYGGEIQAPPIQIIRFNGPGDATHIYTAKTYFTKYLIIYVYPMAFYIPDKLFKKILMQEIMGVIFEPTEMSIAINITFSPAEIESIINILNAMGIYFLSYDDYIKRDREWRRALEQISIKEKIPPPPLIPVA